MLNQISEYDLDFIGEIIDWIKKTNYKAKFGSQIGDFILACSIEETNSNLKDYTNRYSYNLVVDKSYLQKAKLYKKISSDLVFNSSQIHKIEFKGDIMLSRMFKAMEENYIKNVRKKKLLSNFADKLIRNEKDEQLRARLVCDYLSGMTDSYAIKTYKNLLATNPVN